MLLATLKATPLDMSGGCRTFGKGVGSPGLTTTASSDLAQGKKTKRCSGRGRFLCNGTEVQAHRRLYGHGRWCAIIQRSASRLKHSSEIFYHVRKLVTITPPPGFMQNTSKCQKAAHCLCFGRSIHRGAMIFSYCLPALCNEGCCTPDVQLLWADRTSPCAIDCDALIRDSVLRVRPINDDLRRRYGPPQLEQLPR